MKTANLLQFTDEKFLTLAPPRGNTKKTLWQT